MQADSAQLRMAQYIRDTHPCFTRAVETAPRLAESYIVLRIEQHCSKAHLFSAYQHV